MNYTDPNLEQYRSLTSDAIRIYGFTFGKESTKGRLKVRVDVKDGLSRGNGQTSKHDYSSRLLEFLIRGRRERKIARARHRAFQSRGLEIENFSRPTIQIARSLPVHFRLI